MKDIISFCSWTLHSHVGLIHQDSPQTESSWARMPQTLTKRPAGATDGLRRKSSLNPWEERGWSESLHLSYQALWNAPRLLGNTMPNSPRKMDMDYTQVFRAWRISPKPSNDIWKSWKAPTCYFSLSGKAETVTPVEHRAPVSFWSLIWKPIREEFKVIASSHRHFAPKQLRWLSWEFILAVKSIVTDLVHENITKSYLISVLGWLVRQINQVGRQFWFSKPSLPGLRFEDPRCPSSLAYPEFPTDAILQSERHPSGERCRGDAWPTTVISSIGSWWQMSLQWEAGTKEESRHRNSSLIPRFGCNGFPDTGNVQAPSLQMYREK